MKIEINNKEEIFEKIKDKNITLDFIRSITYIYEEDDDEYHEIDSNGGVFVNELNLDDYCIKDTYEIGELYGRKKFIATYYDEDYSISDVSIDEFKEHLENYGLDIENFINVITLEIKENDVLIEIDVTER